MSAWQLEQELEAGCVCAVAEQRKKIAKSARIGCQFNAGEKRAGTRAAER